ncbi:methyltransferase, FkbM family [Shimia gijangensis]|uniref:Methyltransferase, FkbM family n=1 Tax=Shimia gijangensis TaxID=1470563 RepID=A0A1M6ENP1_9RHOB|nr:FkbM family methyltransferase [Shimia gijangensis]SHI87137.1 methyltransferase, FkbM family [Shimia gijangensis]
MKDWIRGKLRARRANRLLQKEAVQTDLGFLFAGPEAMTSGVFEPKETAILTALLSDADKFVNVGANFGYYVCLAQSLGVPSVAVEPVPVNLEILHGNIARNGYGDNVTVFPNACGEAEGEAEIFGVGTGASLVKGWARNPESLAHKVPIRRLDDMVPAASVTSRTVFLVDVEGFELEVIKGADGILSREDKPIWLMETGLTDHRSEGGLNPQFEEVFTRVSQYGYEFYCVEQPDKPVTRDIIQESLERGVDLIGGINFLLVPVGHPVGHLFPA